MASRRAPDPLGWINTNPNAPTGGSTSRPTRQGQRTISSFATPPPSTSKRPRLSEDPVLPSSGSRAARRKQGDLRAFMHPTPPDSRSRPKASTQAASPLTGRAESQRRCTKSGLSSVQQVWSDDEMEPTQAATPRQQPRRTLAAKDPNIPSGTQTNPIPLISPIKTKSTQPMSLTSDDGQITPARARALAACKAIAPVRDKDRAAWNTRAPWITDPMPSPGVRAPLQPPSSTPRKRKRDTPPPTAPADTKSARVKSVLERSFSESIDPESLANFDFEKDVLDRVYRKDKPPPPVKHIPKALERSYTSPASLQGSDPPSDPASALTPLPSSDPPEQSEALIQIAAVKTEPRREVELPLTRTPSPIIPSSDSPHRLHSWAQTLFSQYPSPPPPPPSRRRQFVPAAQQEPETLLTWSAPVSSDPPAPESDTDKLLEDEQDLMRVNAQSLALRKNVENEQTVPVSAAPSSDVSLCIVSMLTISLSPLHDTSLLHPHPALPLRFPHPTQTTLPSSCQTVKNRTTRSSAQNDTLPVWKTTFQKHCLYLRLPRLVPPSVRRTKTRSTEERASFLLLNLSTRCSQLSTVILWLAPPHLRNLHLARLNLHVNPRRSRRHLNPSCQLTASSRNNLSVRRVTLTLLSKTKPSSLMVTWTTLPSIKSCRARLRLHCCRLHPCTPT